MKKLLFNLSLTLTICASTTFAQSTATTTVVKDVLHYYFNKQYFRTGYQVPVSGNVGSNYQYYKSAAAISTVISHVGNLFENKESIEITGLEAYVAMGPYVFNSSGFNVRLYLCNVDGNKKPVLGANNKPVILDSITTLITTQGGSRPYILIGGDFKNPVTVNQDFAVLFRNMSLQKGDTALLMRTSAKTMTAYPGVPWKDKYSDSYGFVRTNNAFVSTKDLNMPTYGFSIGTDYEFCVAPRVQYTLSAQEELPAQIQTNAVVSTYEQMIFKNLSSSQFTNRFFNLQEFYKKWNLVAPLLASPPGGWNADSTVTWYFLSEEKGPTSEPRRFLPYGGGNNQLIYYTDNADDTTCYKGNHFTAFLKGMNIAGTGSVVANTEQFDFCSMYGNGDALGLSKNSNLNKVVVFPNPSTNGKVIIKGLEGKNEIFVYDLMGQLILNEKVENGRISVDLSTQAKGSYFIKVKNDSQNYKTFKIQKIE